VNSVAARPARKYGFTTPDGDGYSTAFQTRVAKSPEAFLSMLRAAPTYDGVIAAALNYSYRCDLSDQVILVARHTDEPEVRHCVGVGSASELAGIRTLAVTSDPCR